MASYPWRRRPTDSPRPPARRWRRLRSGSALARRVLTGRRRGGQTLVEPPGGRAELVGSPPGSRPSVDLDADPLSIRSIAPTSPAIPSPPGPPPAGPLTVPLLPGEHTARRRLSFAAANGCTLTSLVLGVGAILLALDGSVAGAAACLIGCVVFDGLDGGLARRLGVASPFGAQLDSLADMCAFGVAAPVLAYRWLDSGTPRAVLVPICALVAVCAAVRLARFNVSPKDGRYFCGVPTTMAAAILALTALLNPRPEQAPLLVTAVVIVGGLAVLMVSTFPYAKFGQLRRLPPWLWTVPLVGLMVNVSATFVALVAAYLVSGPLLWLKHRRTA